MPKAQPVTDPDAPIRVSDLEIGALGEHDGVPVTEVRTTLTGADGFLSESMRLAQVHLPHGSRVFVLVEAFVESHEYDYPKVKGEYDREQEIETAVLKAQTAMFLDPDPVAEAMALHKARILERRAQIEIEKAEARGEFTLPFPDADDDSASNIHRIRDEAQGG
jgi:hypothetical protein